jgi:ABC-type Mn2+/Zn2+ transport system ATPase subunit
MLILRPGGYSWVLEQLRSAHVTVLVSTHDLNMAIQRFDRVLLLNKRLIAYGVAKEVFTPETIREAFGAKVLDLQGMMVVDDCCPPDEYEHGH